MVAITVILAAVIGTFVLGLGDNIQTNVQAGATVSGDTSNHEASVTYTTNQNADNLRVTITDPEGHSAEYTTDSVGSKITFGPFDSSTDTASVTKSGSWTAVTGSEVDQDTATATFGLVNDADETVSVVITAEKGDQSTVILSKDIQV
jgi:FlaG/FlaF family flagellin (archaellin)